MKELSQRDGVVQMDSAVRASDTLSALFCNIQGSIVRDRDTLQDLTVDYALHESEFNMVNEAIWAYTVAKRNAYDIDLEEDYFPNVAFTLPEGIHKFIKNITQLYRDSNNVEECLGKYRKDLEQQLVDLEELQDSYIDTIELKIDQLIELNNLASKGN